MDGDDQKQRPPWLTARVQDGRRLLGLAAEAQAAHPEPAEARGTAAALRERWLAQEVEEKPEGGCPIQEGTEKDRVVRVADPEMRHGPQSARQRFNGHQATVAVERDSPLIRGVEVLAGNAGDQEKALDLVPQSERVREAEGVETVGDGAYGGGPTRRALADEERGLTAKVPASSKGGCFPKRELVIDLEKKQCAARPGRRRGHITRRETVRADIACWPRPSARPAGGARQACGGKGRAPLRSRRKKACRRERAPPTQRRRDARVCGNEGWWSIGSRGGCSWGFAEADIWGEPRPACRW